MRHLSDFDFRYKKVSGSFDANFNKKYEGVSYPNDILDNSNDYNFKGSLKENIDFLGYGNDGTTFDKMSVETRDRSKNIYNSVLNNQNSVENFHHRSHDILNQKTEFEKNSVNNYRKKRFPKNKMVKQTTRSYNLHNHPGVTIVKKKNRLANENNKKDKKMKEIDSINNIDTIFSLNAHEKFRTEASGRAYKYEKKVKKANYMKRRLHNKLFKPNRQTSANKKNAINYNKSFSKSKSRLKRDNRKVWSRRFIVEIEDSKVIWKSKYLSKSLESEHLFVIGTHFLNYGVFYENLFVFIKLPLVNFQSRVVTCL